MLRDAKVLHPEGPETDQKDEVSSPKYWYWFRRDGAVGARERARHKSTSAESASVAAVGTLAIRFRRLGKEMPGQ